MDNATFLLQHAGRGRIGLCGGRDPVSRLIRKAQAPLTADGHRSLWSHAFLFTEQRADGHWWVVESDLDVRYRQVRLGAQENRLARYFDADAFPNIAVLDFGLDDAQAQQCHAAALDVVAGLAHYSLSELVGTLLGMHSMRLRRRDNLLAREGALYCSALVQHCYARAGVTLFDDVTGKNVTPHDLAQSPALRHAHRLVRDLGVSTMRNAFHTAADALGVD